MCVCVRVHACVQALVCYSGVFVVFLVGPHQYISLLILSADIGLLQIYIGLYRYWRIFSLICADIKTVFKAGKNAWNSNLKWCNL